MKEESGGSNPSFSAQITEEAAKIKSETSPAYDKVLQKMADYIDNCEEQCRVGEGSLEQITGDALDQYSRDDYYNENKTAKTFEATEAKGEDE